MRYLLSIFVPILLFALDKPGDELNLVGLKTALGQQVDLNLELRDATGKKLKLQEFFNDDRPIILVPGYYTCPRLCSLVFDGVSKLLSELELELGSEYQVLTVSFDSRDTSERALKYQSKYRSKANQTDNSGWKFLVGEQPEVSSLMNQLGYRYLNDGKDFAHTAALFILTPAGVISQYYAGIDFSPFDVRLSLIEASKNKVGSLLDHALLFCYRFDPTKGKYTPFAFGIMRLGGVITLIILGSFLIRLWIKEAKDKE